MTVFKVILNHAKRFTLAFHLPGHAGRSFWPDALAQHARALGLSEPLLRHDVTEVDGLDVLSTPTGVIAESQAFTAQTFGARESFYLINGSSGGIHAALLAALAPGETILLPRNAHRSAMAGLVMTGAVPAWVYPDWEADWGIWGALTVAALSKAYAQHPQAKAVLVTSPTYEGVVSPIAEIAAWCREKNLLLMVDEAHGCLFGHASGLPPSSIAIPGVDAVIQSPHKTAGALTQAALLHLPHGSRFCPARVQASLNHLQSTSPSYLLLASLELTSLWLASSEGKAQLAKHVKGAQQVRQHIHTLAGLHLLEHPSCPGAGLDPLRLYLRHTTLSGDELADTLEGSHHIAGELSTPYGALYLLQPGHTETDFSALVQALKHFVQAHPAEEAESPPLIPSPDLPAVVQVLSPRDAFFHPQEAVPVGPKLIGRISAETVVSCPPGVPVLLPGERVQPAHLYYLADLRSLSCTQEIETAFPMLQAPKGLC